MPSKISPIAAIIASYRSRLQPCSSYLHNLAALAVRLQNLRSDSWYLNEEVCEHYVYVFLNPTKPGRYEYTCPSGKAVHFEYEPYYVGKGKDRRAASHFKDSQLKKKSHKNHTIKMILDAGFDPEKYVTITPSRRTDWMAQALEIDLIAGIGRRDQGTGPLTNLTDGGDGAAGHSEETREKIRQAKLGSVLSPEHRAVFTNKGRKFSPEHRQKLSVSSRGRKHSKETRQLLQMINTGKKRSAESIERTAEANRGKKRTLEQRQRISASLKGKPKSAEHVANIMKARANLVVPCKLFLTHKGQTKSLQDWSTELDLRYGTLKARYHKGLDAAKILSPIKLNLVTHKGEVKTLADWSRHLRIPLETLRSRVKAGRPLC